MYVCMYLCMCVSISVTVGMYTHACMHMVMPKLVNAGEECAVV